MEKRSPKPDFTGLRTGLLCHFVFYRTAIIKKITLEKTAGETTLWMGEFNVTWSSAFETLKDESINLINYGTFAEGKTLRAYLSGEGQGAATTAWWNNFTTCLDGEASRGDIMISGDMVWSIHLINLDWKNLLQRMV